MTSAIIMLPIILYANVAEKWNGKFTCNVLWPASDMHTSGFSFTIYTLVLGFVTPLCFIMTFYCLVIRKLRSMAKKTNKSKGKRRSHRKVTKLVLTVITVYVLCWLPYWLSQVSLMTSTSPMCRSQLEVVVFLLVGCLGYINSAINPILYAYLSDNFKKSFLKACTCATAKDVNAQLKMENSVLPKKVKDCRTSESQFTLTTRCNNMINEVTTATTLTAVSNVSSRNPSPPPANEMDASRNDNLLQLS